MRNKAILVLSGQICSGKSTLAKALEEKYGFVRLHTRDAIKNIYKNKRSNFKRLALQKFGENLDVDTKGAWIITYFQEAIKNNPYIVVDSVRINDQVKAFREAFGPQSVFHIHLTASNEELKERYFNRNENNLNTSELEENYLKIKSDKTESKVENLISTADLVIHTDRNSSSDVLVRTLTYLKILPPVDRKLVDVIIGGQFGSEGKGQIAAYLSREYDCLVRIGGPNAGHSVFGNPPEVFHLLPSGTTKAPLAKLILGPGSVISLERLINEIKNYVIDINRLLIDENVTVISQKDIKKEEKLDKIGSTKQGVGLATANNIISRILGDASNKAKNKKELIGFIGSAHEEYEKLYREGKKILLEGTQGTFLSLHHGFYPYVTSRDTIVSGCLSEAGISPRRVNRIIMVNRTYPIRVQSPADGTSGPFGKAKEINLETISARSGIELSELQKTEKTTTTKRERRIAEFSWELFRRACEINSPTDVALTFTDYISSKNKKAYRYEQLTEQTIQFIEDLERCGGVPVSLISTDFSHRSIIDRRKWI